MDPARQLSLGSPTPRLWQIVGRNQGGRETDVDALMTTVESRCRMSEIQPNALIGTPTCNTANRGHELEDAKASSRPRRMRKLHIAIGVAIAVLLAFIVVAGILLSRRDGGDDTNGILRTSGGSGAPASPSSLPDSNNASTSTSATPTSSTTITTPTPPLSLPSAAPSTTAPVSISPTVLPRNTTEDTPVTTTSAPSPPVSLPPAPELPDPNCVLLRQSDFANGTYLIQTPGCYRLAEDICFSPNSRDAPEGAACPTCHNWPQPSQFWPAGPYDPRAFGIGFFAAIAISTDNVRLDLNGHTLEQSAEHALAQRFFANIELASTPFFHGQGPFDFGSGIAAHHVIIENGRLGRSSHHGIHGNQNVNITLRHIAIVDWEVAGIALNGGRDIRIENVEIGPNFHRVPVTGMFSAARFLNLYLSYLQPDSPFNVCSSEDNQPLVYDFNPFGGPGRKTASQVWDDLVAFEEQIFDTVLRRASENATSSADHAEIPALVRNYHGLTDGNIYGIVLHGRGVAVNGMGPSPTRHIVGENENIVITHTRILGVRASVQEITGLRVQTDPGSPLGGVETDAIGAVFQFLQAWSAPSTRVYFGNPIANAQIFVAAHAACLPSFLSSRSTISASTLNWARGAPLTLPLAEDPAAAYACNGDSMFHVNKGVFGIRIDTARNVLLDNVQVGGDDGTVASAVANLGSAGSPACGEYRLSKSHPAQTQLGYNGADTRGIGIAASEHVRFNIVTVGRVLSSAGDAMAVDVAMGSSNIHGAVAVRHRPATCVADSDILERSQSLVLDKWPIVASVCIATNCPQEIPVACPLHFSGDTANLTLALDTRQS